MNRTIFGIRSFTLTALSWLSDANTELRGIGAQTHDAAMCWGAGKSLQLAVRTGDAVESLSDVSGSFQQHVLQEVKYSDQQRKTLMEYESIPSF